MNGWAVYPASKSDRGRFGWQERQPNRPLSDSLAQNSIESARPVCSPAGHAIRPASKPFRTAILFSEKQSYKKKISIQSFY